jgi:hypothetical protein
MRIARRVDLLRAFLGFNYDCPEGTFLSNPIFRHTSMFL